MLLCTIEAVYECVCVRLSILHFLLFPMISYHYTQLISNMVSQLINKIQFTLNDQRVVNFLKIPASLVAF